MTADMIRKDAALKGYDTALSILNNAINAVSEAKAIVLQYGSEPEQRWIPCSERLPEEGQEVLATIKNGAIYTDTDKWIQGSFWYHGHYVIAWMPLPEPYKGEREGTE